MGTISIKIQNRTYRLSCGEGEEERLTELAEHVREKADNLTEEFGRIGEEHMLLMSAILIADELWDERAAKPSNRKTPRSKGASKEEADEAAVEPA